MKWLKRLRCQHCYYQTDWYMARQCGVQYPVRTFHCIHCNKKIIIKAKRSWMK
jgi:DNA-directed RNA polymerase subunit RPC12/RpoP